MAGYGYPNGRGRLGFRTGVGWSNSAYHAEVNQNDVKAMPGVIDCPNCDKDGAIADGFPNKGGSYQSGSLYARDQPRAQESINNVQNAGSDGGRTRPAGIFGHQKFDHGGYEVGADGMNTNRWNSPAYGRYEYSPDNVSTEATLITTGGWTLGKATNDIGTAAGYLRESARPLPVPMAGAGRWNSASPNTYQPKKRDSAPTTIDSREAAKKYGGVLV